MRTSLVLALAVALQTIAGAQTLNIVGFVSFPNGDRMPGLTVNLTGPVTATTQTNAEGRYSFLSLAAGAYTVTPVGCDTFVPASREIDLTGNANQQNFVGECPPIEPSALSPIPGSTEVSLSAVLSWSAPGATDYEVYFGGVTLPYVANTTTPSYDPAGDLSPGQTYYWRIRAINAYGQATSPIWQFSTLTVPTSGLRFVPVEPCRLVDTRPDEGKEGDFGPPSLEGEVPRTFPVTGCGIPVSAKAYALNITVVPIEGLGYLTVWATGNPQPLASTLNSHDGRVVANAAIIPAGEDNSIDVFASNATDLVIDVNGYFDDQAGSAGALFYPLEPCRIADSRDADLPEEFGPPSLAGGESREFPVPLSACLPPGVDVTAYSLNVTVDPLTGLGFLTVHPTGQDLPLVSTLNSHDGNVLANAAIVPAGTEGAIDVFPSNPTDVILDTNGYFGPEGDNEALVFHPVAPCRILDTRENGGGILPAMSTSDIPISGSCNVPATAQAYALNVTVVPTGTLSYLTLYPTGQAQPFVSTLNSPLGRVLANAAIAPAGTNGAVSVFVTQETHLVIDINGYFAPPEPL